MAQISQIFLEHQTNEGAQKASSCQMHSGLLRLKAAFAECV